MDLSTGLEIASHISKCRKMRRRHALTHSVYSAHVRGSSTDLDIILLVCSIIVGAEYVVDVARRRSTRFLYQRI